MKCYHSTRSFYTHDTGYPSVGSGICILSLLGVSYFVIFSDENYIGLGSIQRLQRDRPALLPDDPECFLLAGLAYEVEVSLTFQVIIFGDKERSYFSEKSIQRRRAWATLQPNDPRGFFHRLA